MKATVGYLPPSSTLSLPAFGPGGAFPDSSAVHRLVTTQAAFSERRLTGSPGWNPVDDATGGRLRFLR
jgi:hypothetical protein